MQDDHAKTVSFSSADFEKENLRLKKELEETIARLKDRMRRLDDLEEAGKLLSSTFDLERILFHLMYFQLKITSSDNGSIMLLEGNRMISKIAWGLDERTLQGIKMRASGLTVCEEALKSQKLLVFLNPAEHPDIIFEEVDMPIKSIICIPLLSKDRAVGVLNIANCKQINELDDFARKTIGAIAGFAAVAIDNAILHQEALEKQKYEHELDLGRDIQLRLLPQSPPNIKGYEISTKYSATHEIGGDYYDLIRTGDLLHVIIADVSNKGVPAALVMTATRAVLRGNIGTLSSPKEVVERSNKMIWADINKETDMFVSLFYGCIEIKERKMAYTNAGHCYPLVFRAGQDEPIRLKEGGLFLGIMEDTEYEEGEIHLEEGDLVFFYTDGVIESQNPSSELFGEKRLCDFLIKNYRQTTHEIVNSLFSELGRFGGYMPQADDIAMVAVKIH